MLLGVQKLVLTPSLSGREAELLVFSLTGSPHATVSTNLLHAQSDPFERFDEPFLEDFEHMRTLWGRY
jgi:hypothetical protein